MKYFKPITPGQRQKTTVDYSALTPRTKPEKSLLAPYAKKSGHGALGRITVRHRGGGHKRRYRIIDFKGDKFDVPATISSIEYDPNRSAFIALLSYKDGEKRYILAPKDVGVGNVVLASKNRLPAEPGNRMPLKFLPVGTFVHNVELFPGRGGAAVRSAGSYAEVLAQEGRFTNLKLPSIEVRKFFSECLATIGQLSNSEHNLENLGKAGRARWKGIRPQVRGSAMNPVDHPHGGGEGRQPIGLPGPKTPWGKPALGVRTRDRKKQSSKYIVSRRRK
ncbi:MAG: 50S ribosomal protein L2 [bacterium]|nr:50S ribosomal protein L2 [bacterium]